MLVFARREPVPEKMLIAYAKDDDWRVQRRAARNPDTPVASLVRLARDKDWRVRAAAAEHPSMPVKSLTQLAGDTHWYVRRNVGKNPKASFEILMQLAKDEKKVSSIVLEFLYRNSNIPKELILLLEIVKYYEKERSISASTLRVMFLEFEVNFTKARLAMLKTFEEDAKDSWQAVYSSVQELEIGASDLLSNEDVEMDFWFLAFIKVVKAFLDGTLERDQVVQAILSWFERRFFTEVL